MPPLSPLLGLLPLLSLLSGPADAADLDLGYIPNPEPGEQPALLLTPSRTVTRLDVVIEAGGQSYEFHEEGLAEGVQRRFPWARDTSVTQASAYILAVFDDGYVSELTVPIEYSYGAALSVSLDGATADVKARTLTVQATARVNTAEITAYGAHKAVLDKRTVDVNQGPGAVSIPWVGDPEDVVLLDVTVQGDSAWAGFTYSPWFLDIPHEDVLFDTDQATIPQSEEYKLQHTLAELKDVLDKYGSVVPVKLYIAGCTDTVGDAAHNRDLSQRRAHAIATWLRAHGYDKPIFTHGFGEGLQATPTGDNTDEPRNRRVLYMVGANPPPAGSGVPSVRWSEL